MRDTAGPVLRALAGIALLIWSTIAATLRGTMPWWPIYLTHWTLLAVVLYLVLVMRLELRAQNHAYVELGGGAAYTIGGSDGGASDGGLGHLPLDDLDEGATNGIGGGKASVILTNGTGGNLDDVVKAAAIACRDSEYTSASVKPAAAAGSMKDLESLGQRVHPVEDGQRGTWLELDNTLKELNHGLDEQVFDPTEEMPTAAGSSGGGAVKVVDLTAEHINWSGKVEVALWSISLPGSLLVTMLYWIFIFPYNPLRLIAILEHTVPLLLMALDLRTHRPPPHAYRTVAAWSFAFWTLYIVWTIVFYKIGLHDDAGNRFIYVMVRWDVVPGTAMIACLLVGIVAPVFAVACAWISGRCKRRAELFDANQEWDSI